jgi:hypothetical protein
MAPEERERFEAHVADCSGCEIYLDQMRITNVRAKRRSARLVDLARPMDLSLEGSRRALRQ